MENLPSILTPDLGLLIWMLAAFLVVFFFLARFGFPVIIKMVDERKRYIDDSLSKAHEAAERLLNIKQEGEVLIQEAREQQAKIMKDAATTRDAIIEQAQALLVKDLHDGGNVRATHADVRGDQVRERLEA